MLPAVAAMALAPAQQRPPSLAAPGESPTFKTSATLVTVPVVVRDRDGKAVAGLSKDHFRLTDNGKSQEIAKFSVERIGGSEGEPRRRADAASPVAGPAAPPSSVVPSRFVAYVFDDLHLKFADLVRIREAAARHFRSALQPGDRAAIYSTSGQTALEFTSDRDRLQETLAKLAPRPLSGTASGLNCPDLSYYHAYRIVNARDEDAIRAAVQELMGCGPGTTTDVARWEVLRYSRQTLEMAQLDTRVALSTLRDVIRRLSALPGQRQIVLASPGFQAQDLLMEQSDAIDRAIRANVVISAIDARGLWTDPSYDAGRATHINSGSRGDAVAALRVKAALDFASAQTESNVMADLAAGTGGRFFQNSNNLDDGLRRIAAAPEYVYLLGFAPANLQLDGKYHSLKVRLRESKGLTVEARKGYFAPRSANDPGRQLKQDLFDAVFSRKEMNEFPANLRTQFFKRPDGIARVAVLAHVPLKGLQFFRSEQERNANELALVSTLFDANGNLVGARQQRFELRLKDEALARRAERGFTGRVTFDVKPGSYLVRLVVRDAGGRMTTQNGLLEIPSDDNVDSVLSSVAIRQMMNLPGDLTSTPHVGAAGAIQAAYFYPAPYTAVVRVAAEIPPGVWGDVDVLGVVYASDGRLAARFTNKLQPQFAPVYEDQFELTPGRYRLELSFVSGGVEVGRAEGSLNIEPREEGQFSLSDIAFSKDYRPLDPETRSDMESGLADGLGPLATQILEYPLAPAKRFRRTDNVALYVVLYDPVTGPGGGSPSLLVRERVLDRNSGAVRWDSGAGSAAKYMKSTSTFVSLGLKLPVNVLGPGAYAVEITATDPAGRSAVRAAEFEVW